MPEIEISGWYPKSAEADSDSVPNGSLFSMLQHTSATSPEFQLWANAGANAYKLVSRRSEAGR